MSQAHYHLKTSQNIHTKYTLGKGGNTKCHIFHSLCSNIVSITSRYMQLHISLFSEASKYNFTCFVSYCPIIIYDVVDGSHLRRIKKCPFPENKILRHLQSTRHKFVIYVSKPQGVYTGVPLRRIYYPCFLWRVLLPIYNQHFLNLTTCTYSNHLKMIKWTIICSIFYVL